MLEEMIVWLDFVDTIAISLFGILLTNHPTEIRKLLAQWSKDEVPRHGCALSLANFRGTSR